jgi:4-diphosphocytidyl-2-C-methyl-D-erythritol kinase
MKNVLAPAAIELVPEIGVLKQKLLDAGALQAQMTGSGSAVFGLFETKEAAEAALPAVSDAAFSIVCYSL